MFFIILSCFGLQVSAQILDHSDSVLITRYWDKIRIASITSKSGDLYTNYNNYLEIRTPENVFAPSNIIIKTNNGTIEKDDKNLIAVPKFAGNAYFNIYMINEDNDTILVGRQHLTVRRLPEPCLKIGQTIINDQSKVNRNVFFSGDSLKLFFTDDLPESSQWYHIDYFNSGFTYGGAYFYEENKGAMFSKKSLDLIRRHLPGQDFIIKVMAVSPKSFQSRFLPIIRFKMI
jgi:GldM C-terminal domain.